MKLQIDMIGVITHQLATMRDFYTQAIGLEVLEEMENYIEFKHGGVRFALSTNKVMKNTTGDKSYDDVKGGQSFELVFKVANPTELDEAYAHVIEKGALKIKGPEDKPWGQRAAFFADPDGNIHEIFCDL